MFSLVFFSYKTYEVSLLKLDNPLCAKVFCLPKENKKILSYAPLFYFFQNPIVHLVALTFGDHTMDIEFQNFGSLSFLFAQILVIVI
jgi:hypothetical protein